MPRFYMATYGKVDDSISITGEDVNHIKNALRLKTGDEITLSNGEGNDYICEIVEIRQDEVIVRIVDVLKNASELPTRITLFQGMPKSDKFEFIIQKAVELGVHEIVPVITRRTVVKIDAKKQDKKLERYNAISLSAAKQSGRGIVPVVKPFMSFKGAVDYAGHAREVIKNINGKSSLGIFIGPEGGFSVEEVELAMSNNIEPVTLGNRILRTETAGMAALSIIMFEIDR